MPTPGRIRREAATRCAPIIAWSRPARIGAAHENDSIESQHGHLKRAIEDAAAARLARFRHARSYGLVNEIVGRRNARSRKRLNLERPA
jgi:hypothetical protein